MTAAAFDATGHVPFARRHIGHADEAREHMLGVLGYDSLDALLRAAIPDSIQDADGGEGTAPSLPPAIGEAAALAELRALASRNARVTPLIGQGYAASIMPAAIRRNVLENPGWYTAYTPYQPEISQGRLEALLNFQTMISELMGLEVAGASMLDEATAAAEAMLLMRRANRGRSSRFLVDRDLFASTREVLAGRAEALGIELVEIDAAAGIDEQTAEAGFFGVLLQYPGASGALPDPVPVVERAHAAGALAAVAADPLAACLLRPPGELGADIAVGSTQRFGLPLGFGGPHAGFLAVREKLVRQLPGRLVGVSQDAEGRPALRLALQAREQHIRREKATSNICTAQVLPAVLSSMFAVYHGPEGLREIARNVHAKTVALAAGLEAAGMRLRHDAFFDTIQIETGQAGAAARLVSAAREAGFALFDAGEGRVGVTVDEQVGRGALAKLADALGAEFDPSAGESRLPEAALRAEEPLRHEIFRRHRSETEFMRYCKRLADRDFALDRGMIPLGSCTMKLNSAVEMEPISWPEFAGLHPMLPAADAAGSLELIAQLERWLAELTGYDSVSLQPNAGSQGELAGLLAIRDYHRSRGEGQRDVCLIPQSAHGTNAASAVLAGMRVSVVGTGPDGDIDLADLRERIEQAGDRLAAIMVTYPSTHGVYEEGVREVCDAVHEAGGQVYLDGANLNALLGHARFGRIGGDVSHLNLHKTFCIPHGGGGPGVGPVAARAHLAPFLPSAAGAAHPLREGGEVEHAGVRISGAAFGSASILPITWAYLRMMGFEGLRRATSSAVLAANYIAARLDEHFPVLYRGEHGLVAHECILDLRPLKEATGVTVDDVAKRLIDYGFHAPTMSFPVAGTLMVEPTESEDLAELDRFVEAMISIRAEAEKIASGQWPAEDNPLRRAPHTAESLTGEWERPYDRRTAVYPTGTADRERVAAKYWPPVARVDNAYGDRNLVCSCPPPEAFA
ncbi:MAG: aminomethyl-transferring glycine dehydrogenase [Pseudoclavibacter sp.]|nr:aminomethyl-transferring glycine dehydrogenase [Pseudoclavibacter sp.]